MVNATAGKLTGGLALLALIAAAPLLAGCGFQPLYGPTASGAQLSEVMKAVDVAPIPGRVGQRLRNELIFTTTGGGSGAPPGYRLEIALKESLFNTLVERTGDPKGQIYELFADFKLVRLKDGQVVFEGKSTSRAAYDKVESVFADIRAKRDAENRAARTIAETIRLRLAAYLSSAA